MIILAVLDKSLTKYNRLQSHGRLTLVRATLTTSCRGGHEIIVHTAIRGFTLT